MIFDSSVYQPGVSVILDIMHSAFSFFEIVMTHKSYQTSLEKKYVQQNRLLLIGKFTLSLLAWIARRLNMTVEISCKVYITIYYSEVDTYLTWFSKTWVNERDFTNSTVMHLTLWKMTVYSLIGNGCLQGWNMWRNSTLADLMEEEGELNFICLKIDGLFSK